MSTAIQENYLKALYHLDQADGRISISRLSERLGVSKPTASNMVKSLEEQGWVVYRKYKPVELTEAGRKAAALVIRKHRLTEMFLYEIMGFGWEEVHEIAEQVEHIRSPKLFDRMDEMLHHPKHDPHGSPIPDTDGQVAEPEWKSLTAIAEGRTVRLRALAQSSAELLHFLNQWEITLGAEIEVLGVEAFDNSRLLSFDGKPPIKISQRVGENLLVEEV